MASARAGGGARVRRALLVVALVAFVVLLLRDAAALVRVGRIALTYPFDLDYGEGIVWQQARDIWAGRGYAPLGVYPAIVFHYPPIYHLAALGLARVAGIDELYAGRALSIAATLATMALCAAFAAALLPARSRAVRFTAGACAALLFVAFAPVAMWFAFMRVDMLAGALSLGGLLLAVAGGRRPALIPAAALLFVLAIFTKQTSVAAPAAALAMLAVLRPRSAALLLVLCITLGGAALAGLSWASGGGFLRHILGYNLNRIDPANGWILADMLRDHIVLFGAAGAGVWQTARAMASRTADARDPRAAAPLAALLFLAFKTAMLPMILKSGSSYNYLIEWLSIVAVFAGVGIAPLVTAALRPCSPGPLIVALALLLPVQAARVRGWDVTPAMAQERARALAPLVARIRAEKRPVISDDMILLIRAGRPVRWEPAIAAELAHGGRYDEAAFARLVRARTFAFFVTKGVRGTPLFDDRYNPIVADAIDAAYPRREAVAGLILHLPAAPQR